MKTFVYFVRHAEPDMSIKDDMTRPLSEKGLADSKKVTKSLINHGISAVYSSPYKRSVDTIRDFADSHGLEISTNHNFRERSNGEWVEDFKSYAQKQWQDFNYKLANGECLREVQERNISALHEAINSNKGKKIAIATHGTALSTIINYFTPDFGYDGFWSIIDKMPYILCFEFDEMEFVSVKEIELQDII